MSRTSSGPKEQTEIDRLFAMSEDDIDTDDIPEAPPEAWFNARRPGFSRACKTPVTLRLDADVVER